MHPSISRRWFWWLGVAVAATFACSPSRATSATEGVVRQVIDGDTIELRDGRHVRYIGIDTPETRRRVGERWVEDPEPFAKAATERNRALVEGQVVRLEFDVQPTDRFGRTLAYVYVGDAMVNAQLLEEGMAQLLTIPPDVRYVERFTQLAEQARAARRGLWSAGEGSRTGARGRSGRRLR